MAECKYRTDGGRCLKFTDDGCISFCVDGPCPDAEYKKPNNADRIRAMSDEELAEWIEYNINCSDCRLATMCDVNNGKTCFDWWLDWLKQEVSE